MKVIRAVNFGVWIAGACIPMVWGANYYDDGKFEQAICWLLLSLVMLSIGRFFDAVIYQDERRER